MNGPEATGALVLVVAVVAPVVVMAGWEVVVAPVEVVPADVVAVVAAGTVPDVVVTLTVVAVEVAGLATVPRPAVVVAAEIPAGVSVVAGGSVGLVSVASWLVAVVDGVGASETWLPTKLTAAAESATAAMVAPSHAVKSQNLRICWERPRLRFLCK